MPLDQNMLLRARFAFVGRVRPNIGAPFFAARVRESSAAREKSIRSASASRFKSLWCRRSNTPAACQSRKRRQQVTPEPQPISRGRYSQGMPVLSTYTMPVKAARSDTRGRPPRGYRRGRGSNGSTSFHSSSLTSSFIPQKMGTKIGFERVSYWCSGISSQRTQMADLLVNTGDGHCFGKTSRKWSIERTAVKLQLLQGLRSSGRAIRAVRSHRA